MSENYRRIHFISDFEVYEPSHEPHLYKCKRCGQECIGEQDCYNHRHGLLSECRLNRLGEWWRRNFGRRRSQSDSEQEPRQ